MTICDATIFTKLADHINEGKENPEVVTLQEMVARMLEISPDEISVDSINPQVIVTNKNKYYGAINIYNENCIEQVQKLLNARSFYVLPSSVHEVICISTNDIEVNDLLKMVTEVNFAGVSPEERLGNFVLYYDGNTKQLTKIAEG